MTSPPLLSCRKFLGLLLYAVLLLLTGCAELSGPDTKATVKEHRSLVFPGPPEEGRFIFERAIYGSADVEFSKADVSLKALVTGLSGSVSDDPLAKPYAVAVHHGRIFVSDTVARLVKVFDVPEGRYFTIGADGPGGLKKPLGIDVDATGTLYVVDASAKYVMVYDRDGNFLRKIGGPSMFDRLASVTVDKNGERLYVVDIGGVSSNNHRVRVFEARSGKLLFDIGKRGNGPGEFNMPRDVAVGKNGDLYVVDGANFRIQVFDATGKYLKTFGHIGKQYGDFARPKEVAIDANDNLYVIDAAYGNFQIFDPNGDLLLFVGDRSAQNGPAQYMLPSGITVDEDGRVYVVDQWFHRMDIYRPVKLQAQDGYLGKRPGTAEASKQ